MLHLPRHHAVVPRQHLRAGLPVRGGQLTERQRGEPVRDCAGAVFYIGKSNGAHARIDGRVQRDGGVRGGDGGSDV